MQKIYEDAIAVFDSIAKPMGGLGFFEKLIAQIAAMQGTVDVNIDKKCVLVFCADNGVTLQGVTQFGSEVTEAVAQMLALGRASVNCMAEACGADCFIVDVGMAADVDGLIEKKIARGTADISRKPAMSEEQLENALQIGRDMVAQAVTQGYKIIATGETGMGNTTTSSAMAAALLDKSAKEVTGRGAGLDDEKLARKIAIVEKAVALHSPYSGARDILRKLGGFDIAAMVGVFLGGAEHRIPIVMDGFISSIAALTAVQIHPDARSFILPSHKSREIGMTYVLDALAMQPVLRADMHLGEGTGAVALFPLLDMALCVYHNAARFSELS